MERFGVIPISAFSGAQLELYIVEELGPEYLSRLKNQTELRKVKKVDRGTLFAIWLIAWTNTRNKCTALL